jgi:hypothetical protein
MAKHKKHLPVVEEVVIPDEKEKRERETVLMLGSEHPPKRYTFKGSGVLGTKYGTVQFKNGLFSTGFEELAKTLRKYYEEVV